MAPIKPSYSYIICIKAVILVVALVILTAACSDPAPVVTSPPTTPLTHTTAATTTVPTTTPVPPTTPVPQATSPPTAVPTQTTAATTTASAPETTSAQTEPTSGTEPTSVTESPDPTEQPDTEAATPVTLPEESVVIPEAPPILSDTATMMADPFFTQAFFIGDSIMTALLRYPNFDDHILADLGYSLESVFPLLQGFAHLSPQRIYVLLGSNDITQAYMSEELFTENYLRLVMNLWQLFPEAEIYPQSILPVAHHYSGQPLLTNERIVSYNQALQELCHEMDLTFIDIAADWRLPDNSLHPEVSAADGFHIVSRYYGTWLQVLKDNSE